MSTPSASSAPTRHPTASAARAVIVSTVHTPEEATERLGLEAYSYYFVARAFAPLLQRWGDTIEITHPESRLDYALRAARARAKAPIHLSFLPLQSMYLTAHAPNVAFPFWEFPDLPNAIDDNPRNDWVRIANRLDLILTASRFTADAFVRGGVRTPVRVVPIPIASAYFQVPLWEPGQRVVLDCPAYVLPPSSVNAAGRHDKWPDAIERGRFLAETNAFYLNAVKPRLPRPIARGVTLANRRLATWRHGPGPAPPDATHGSLELDGIVYFTVFNPFDPRKNWQDLLSAYLIALGDRTDATLVVKLVAGGALARPALEMVLAHYRTLGLPHQCRLALVSAFLPDATMAELVRASTYYVTSSRAEGACLPVEESLAAGRPAIAPCHSALADYFDEQMGFVVASHPEPTSWPHDPKGHCTTRWHRLVWQSLHDQLITSYRVVRERLDAYRALAEHGRAAMERLGSAEVVWAVLSAALDEVAGHPPAQTRSPS